MFKFRSTTQNIFIFFERSHQTAFVSIERKKIGAFVMISLLISNFAKFRIYTYEFTNRKKIW